MAGLQFKHMYKVYGGGVRAVNDFNLEIKDKSFVVLVGPSGCGKSTTLRMVAGLESITSGQLFIDDVMVNDVESKNRDIAMVFQSYALYPHMTVFQNMGFGLKLRHVSPAVIRQKVEAAAEILEISDLLDRKPKELSGGQRQRVALGRAIVREPNVFLLDEPLSNLDAKLRVQMRTEITKLHEKLQTTFIYVTHDQTEAMTMGDTIVVMNKGYIQQADAPVTLFEDPANLFVATFLGSPQMNIIDSKLVKNGDKIGVVLAGEEENVVWLREETVNQIIRSGIDLNKEYLFGIRPDQIKISNSGVPAHVEVVEQLGDETIIYAKIAGRDKNIIVKTPLLNSVKSQDDIFITFSNERVYLFDKETEHSLIGMPSFSKLPCTIDGSKKVITIGKQKLSIDDEYMSHLADKAFVDKCFLTIKPEQVQLDKPVTTVKNEEGEEVSVPSDAISVDVKVDFIEERTNYNIVYATLEGIKPYLIFRASKERKLASGEELDVYLPFDYAKITDEKNNSLYLRETVFANIAKAKVSTLKDNRRVIDIDGGEKLIYDELDVEDGEYLFKLKQDKVQIVFNKKVAKAIDDEGVLTKAPKGQTLSVSCYDEEPQMDVNYIYAQIKGFNEYVTLSAKNNFSVYKMPKFKVVVPRDGFELKTIG